jgi:hypothetical protein
VVAVLTVTAPAGRSPRWRISGAAAAGLPVESAGLGPLAALPPSEQVELRCSIGALRRLLANPACRAALGALPAPVTAVHVVHWRHFDLSHPSETALWRLLIARLSADPTADRRKSQVPRPPGRSAGTGSRR